MEATRQLTLQLVEEALVASGIRYEFDEDGDIRVGFVRQHGRDLDFVIFTEGIQQGFLSVNGYCQTYFRQRDALTALIFCNTWNREKKQPRAYLTEADSEGDHLIVLDFHMLCRHEVALTTVRENLDFVFACAYRFWEAAEAEI